MESCYDSVEMFGLNLAETYGFIIGMKIVSIITNIKPNIVYNQLDTLNQ